MKRYIVFFVFFVVVLNSMAQGYNQAIGVRAGWISPGIEYRYYRNDKNSLRASLTARNRGVQLLALSEYYQYDLFKFSEQLIFYYGIGLHLGIESWNERKIDGIREYDDDKHAFITGLDGVIGLEYVFYEVPLKLGIEMKPFFDIGGEDDFNITLPDFALTFRFLF